MSLWMPQVAQGSQISVLQRSLDSRILYGLPRTSMATADDGLRQKSWTSGGRIARKGTSFRLGWSRSRSVVETLLGLTPDWLPLTSTKIFTGAVPFNNDPPCAAMSTIVEGKRPQRPTHPAFTDGLWALTQRCWDQKAHLRPQVSEALRILRGL